MNFTVPIQRLIFVIIQKCGQNMEINGTKCGRNNQVFVRNIKTQISMISSNLGGKNYDDFKGLSHILLFRLHFKSEL